MKDVHIVLLYRRWFAHRRLVIITMIMYDPFVMSAHEAVANMTQCVAPAFHGETH